MAFETPPRWSIVIAYSTTIVVGLLVAIGAAGTWWRVVGGLVATYGGVCFLVTCGWGRFVPRRWWAD